MNTHILFTKINIVLIIISLFIISFLSFTLNASAAVDASDAAQQSVCSGIGAVTGSESTCEDPEGSPTIDNTISSIINILSIVVGAASVIMLIIGGLKFVSSQGDSGAIKSARNTILYALVGIIIVALSQIIVRFVVNTATEVPAEEAFIQTKFLG